MSSRLAGRDVGCGPTFYATPRSKDRPWVGRMHAPIGGMRSPLGDARSFLYSTSGPLAQLVEQGTFNPKVAGSSPARPTRKGLQSARFVNSIVPDRRSRAYE